MKAKKWLILGLSAVMSVAVGIGISACGKKDHTHTYDAWDWNETQHWKYCDEHGEDKSNIDETTRADHDFSNGNCVCGAEKPADTPPEHEHTYDAWDHDATQHWKYCDEHGDDKSNIDETTRADHDFSNGNCVCGAEKPADTDEADTRVFYVVGSVVDGYWHTEGTHLPLQLERTAGYTYEISLALYKGETFKIVGFAEEPTEDPASKMYDLQADYGDYAEPDAELFTASGMQDFTVAKDGVYTIKLHTDDAANTGEDTDKFSVEIERDDDIAWDLYIFGTMTNWTKNEEYKMEGTGTTYTFTLNVTQDMIDTTVDSEGTKTKPALKVVNVTSSGNKYFGDGEDKNIEFEEAGEYTITFDSTTYAVTSAAKEPEDVAHDMRTYVLCGASTESDGTLNGNGFEYKSTDPKVTFVRTFGTNTFVLKDVTLYEGDSVKIRFNSDWNSGSQQFSFGAEILYTATTVDSEGNDLGKIFVSNTTSTKFTDNGYIAKNMSGVYDIELTSNGQYTSTTAASQNQVTLKFTRKQQLEDPDRSVIDFYLVGTIVSKGMNNKWPGAGVTGKDLVHLEKTAANTYSVTATFAASDSFKVYCMTFGSWHTLGAGKNESNMSVAAGEHTVTVTVTAGATNLRDGDSRVTVAIT